jgi:hypothetical protein
LSKFRKIAATIAISLAALGLTVIAAGTAARLPGSARCTRLRIAETWPWAEHLGSRAAGCTKRP